MPADEQNNKRPQSTARAVFTRRGFWVNYVLTLVLTCWIPLLTITPRFTMTAPVPVQTEDNTQALSPAPEPPTQNPAPAQVVEGESRRVPLYECYTGFAGLVIKGDFTNKALRIYGGAVLAHLLLCLAISFWVWYLVLRSAGQAKTET